MPINQDDVIRIPLTSRLPRIFGRRNSSKDCSHSLNSLHATVAINNLSFVDPPQIDAAVATGRNIEFDL